MARDYSEQITRLEHKIELLLTRHEMVLESRRRLADELSATQAALHASQAALEKMQVQIEYLQVSSALATDDATVLQTRNLLSDLVREIDACIADIIKDV